MSGFAARDHQVSRCSARRHLHRLHLGAGGHTEEILRGLSTGRVLGVDRDAVALAVARERLKVFGEKLVIMHGNFADIEALHRASALPLADGLLADLGMSSLQLDNASRGFSFNSDGNLDMRFDSSQGPTAADLVNTMSERELTEVISRYGEERHARRIARKLLRGRPFKSSRQLALAARLTISSQAAPQNWDMVRRTFQALRLAVNRELECLESLLGQVLRVLKPGGRVVILGYHSLEDVRVKHAFRSWQQRGEAEILTRKVVRPGDEELGANPRARSAKLRAAKKVSV